jgi:hypothetical protein
MKLVVVDLIAMMLSVNQIVWVAGVQLIARKLIRVVLVIGTATGSGWAGNEPYEQQCCDKGQKAENTHANSSMDYMGTALTGVPIKVDEGVQ